MARSHAWRDTRGLSTRVLIADDHRLMREGTAALLAADPRLEVAGLARDGREAVELAVRLTPDVVLLDLGMPDIDGIEACAAIRARGPSARVLMLTVSEDELDLKAALRVGAAGYLLKDMPPAALGEAGLGGETGGPGLTPHPRDGPSRGAGGGGRGGGDGGAGADAAPARRAVGARARGAGADRARAAQPRDRRASRGE